MESQAEQPPLKVCRHCSVASRTEAETCPSCGRPYARRIWRWWFAIPIVAAAFAIGFFGLSELIEGEEDPVGITLEEGEGVSLGASSAELEKQLDGQAPILTQRPGAGGAEECLYYGIVDRDDAVWMFCFSGDELVASEATEVPEEP